MVGLTYKVNISGFQFQIQKYVGVYNPATLRGLFVGSKDLVTEINNQLKNKTHISSCDILNKRVEKIMVDYGFISTVGTQVKTSTDIYTWIHVSNECNLRCTYCYVNKTATQMSLETYKNIVDSLYSTSLKHESKILKLKYAGGEPLIRFENLKKMVEYTQYKFADSTTKVKYSLITNGTIVTDGIATFLKENNFTVAISLDGFKELHDKNRPFINGNGSFERTFRGVSILKKHRVPLNLSITVTRDNAPSLFKLVKSVMAQDLTFHINFVRETCRTSCGTNLDTDIMVRELSKIIHYFKKMSYAKIVIGSMIDIYNYYQPHQAACGAGSNYLVFNTQGNLVPCQMSINSQGFGFNKEDLLAFNYSNNPLAKVNDVNLRNVCTGCMWRHICCGGCPHLAQIQFGSAAHPTPFCEINKQIIPKLLKLEACRMIEHEVKHSLH